MKLDDNWKPIGEAAKRVGDKLARDFVDRMSRHDTAHLLRSPANARRLFESILEANRVEVRR